MSNSSSHSRIIRFTFPRSVIAFDVRVIFHQTVSCQHCMSHQPSRVIQLRLSDVNVFIFTLESLCLIYTRNKMNSNENKGEDLGKMIYLIRHAESENNVNKRAYKESLGKLRMPSWTQVKTMAPLMVFPMNTNSPLSKKGVRQVLIVTYLA